MIQFIHIKNFAIIDEVELELSGGLTVLTGETGAGKSILIDALGLALGGRADSGVVRAPADRAEITVAFDVADLPDTLTWLSEQSLHDGTDCVIRRSIGVDGRSRAFVNGRAVAAGSLRELGRQLADIHGQQEQQSLSAPAVQRHLLDYHGTLGATAERTAQAWQEWQDAEQAAQQLRTDARDHEQRMDWLRHQVQELETLALAPGDYESCGDEFARHKHAGRLLDATGQALLVLDDAEVTAQSLLARGIRNLQQAAALDPSLAPIAELLDQAQVQLEEGVRQLRSYRDTVDLQPDALERLEQRLHDIRELARKHRVEPEQLHTVLPQLAASLAQMRDADAHIDTLLATAADARRRFLRHAAQLTEGRGRAAPDLGAQVTAVLRELGIPDGLFTVDLRPLTEAQWSRHGQEDVAFLVSANAGQPPGPIAKVASGGELSRIALALHVVAAGGSPVPCMVFDEVDTGVGGRVAEIVGRKLRDLGRSRQVLCVTHLPQVASLGHHHLRVLKESSDGRTHTAIARLGEAERIEELARMLGGVAITAGTRAYAAELLSSAAD